MKALLLILTVCTLISNEVSAQFSENFDQNITGLASNCWVINQVNYSTTSSDVINGTGSAYTNPPTSGSGERTLATPFLNVTSTSLTVSFKYKTSSRIAGQATRTINIGLLDKNGTFLSLQVITMDRNSATSVYTHNGTYTLPSTGVYRLELRIGGATGDGNSRVIFDDLSVNASAYYGPVVHCNPAATAVNDTDSSQTISQVSGNVLTNDLFPADNETYSAVLVAAPAQGSVVLNSDGTFIYTPAVGFTGGTITFTYSVTDNGYTPSTSNIATVTINYAPLLMLPVTNRTARNTTSRENIPTNEIIIRQNPVMTDLHVTFSASASLQSNVSIYSMSGAIIHQENKMLSKGANVLHVNVTRFQPGMYVVVINNREAKTASRFIKKG